VNDHPKMTALREAQEAEMLAAANALIDLGVRQAHERLILAAEIERGDA
jgi:hypothetical protein